MRIGIIVLAAMLGLAFGCMAYGQNQREDDDEVVLTLERLSAPFDGKAKILVQQKGGKFKEYAPKDHETFDKEVEDGDLEITEIHVKDRKIIKLVFEKKLKKQ